VFWKETPNIMFSHHQQGRMQTTDETNPIIFSRSYVCNLELCEWSESVVVSPSRNLLILSLRSHPEGAIYSVSAILFSIIESASYYAANTHGDECGICMRFWPFSGLFCVSFSRQPKQPVNGRPRLNVVAPVVQSATDEAWGRCCFGSLSKHWLCQTVFGQTFSYLLRCTVAGYDAWTEEASWNITETFSWILLGGLTSTGQLNEAQYIFVDEMMKFRWNCDAAVDETKWLSAVVSVVPRCLAQALKPLTQM
jgi:hypothetical protein